MNKIIDKLRAGLIEISISPISKRNSLEIRIKYEVEDAI